MGGSTADTPTTPEFLRVSDADRDHAVNELRDEFVEGRLSHETFVYRMQTALDARNHGQLAKLFTDLPPRRHRAAELLARVKAALRGDARGPKLRPDAAGTGGYVVAKWGIVTTWGTRSASLARLAGAGLAHGPAVPARLHRRRFPSRRAAAGASRSGGPATATCA